MSSLGSVAHSLERVLILSEEPIFIDPIPPLSP